MRPQTSAAVFSIYISRRDDGVKAARINPARAALPAVTAIFSQHM
jgi:hypothetical protein